MATIAQRELRNKVSDVLRRAERGERFTITVNGRAVAELGPLGHPGRPATGEQLSRLLAESPVDGGWREDLERLRDAEHVSSLDPWVD